MDLRSLGCFISFPPLLLFKVLASELQDVSQRTKLCGLPGVCTLGQKSTKGFISAICSGAFNPTPVIEVVLSSF